jgi:hypothetical protein
MRVEVDGDIGVFAKTVGELRKVTAWPENLVITISQEHHVKVGVATLHGSIAQFGRGLET